MKRSTALGLIRGLLEGRERKEDYANEILETVEIIGMQPPWYYVPITDPFDIALVGPGPVARGGWEPEDETE